MDSLISSFQENERDEIRVQLKEFKKKEWLDIRVYTSLKPGAEKAATGRGFSVSFDHFQDFKQAILAAENFLKQKHQSHE